MYIAILQFNKDREGKYYVCSLYDENTNHLPMLLADTDCGGGFYDAAKAFETCLRMAKVKVEDVYCIYATMYSPNDKQVLREVLKYTGYSGAIHAMNPEEFQPHNIANPKVAKKAFESYMRQLREWSYPPSSFGAERNPMYTLVMQVNTDLDTHRPFVSLTLWETEELTSHGNPDRGRNTDIDFFIKDIVEAIEEITYDLDPRDIDTILICARNIREYRQLGYLARQTGLMTAEIEMFNPRKYPWASFDNTFTGACYDRMRGELLDQNLAMFYHL